MIFSEIIFLSFILITLFIFSPIKIIENYYRNKRTTPQIQPTYKPPPNTNIHSPNIPNKYYDRNPLNIDPLANPLVSRDMYKRAGYK